VDAARNRVVVGRESDLLACGMTVREVNWVSCEAPSEPIEAEVRLRYRSRPAPARVSLGAGDRVAVSFLEPQRAVAPGQSAVFYRADVLLGGGVIDAAGTP
jgi:tRNA-specific 2-thiouridylase